MNLRRKIRNIRRSLSPDYTEYAAVAAAKILTGHTLFHQARRIASYIAADGELSPHLLNTLAWRYNKLLAVPKLKSFDTRLWFVEHKITDKMHINKFNIPEPYKTKLIATWSLDLVLVPLVAFDRRGNRLGMGGGFYDKTFELNKHFYKRPKLVGLAHSFQEVTKLEPEPWDVPLNAIVTEKELIIC